MGTKRAKEHLTTRKNLDRMIELLSIDEPRVRVESVEPVILGRSTSKRIDNASSIEIQALQVLKSLDEQDTVNNTALAFAVGSLRDTLGLLPIARDNYLKYSTQSNAYTYNAFLTKCQELLGDIQALQDRGDVGARTVDAYAKPAMKDIAAYLANEYSVLVAEISGVTSNPQELSKLRDLLSRFLRSFGKYLQDRSNKLYSDLIENLGEG